MNQIYYTQCPIGYGLGASSGFQIKRLSPGFPVSSDYRHFSLRAFVGGTRQPAPATLRYRRGEGDVAEIAWITPRSHEYETERGPWGRPGGHFAHGLQLDAAELQALSDWPAGLYDRPFWTRSDREPSRGQPPPDLTLSASDLDRPPTFAAVAPLADGEDGDLLARLLTALATAAQAGRTLFLIDDAARLARRIALLTFAFPEPWRAALTFSTYHERPEELPGFRIQGTIPAARPNRPALLAQGFVADLTPGSETIEPRVEPARWARTLARWLVRHQDTDQADWEATRRCALRARFGPEGVWADEWLERLFGLPALTRAGGPVPADARAWSELATWPAWSARAGLAGEWAGARPPIWWLAAARGDGPRLPESSAALLEHLRLPEAWLGTAASEAWGEAVACWVAPGDAAVRLKTTSAALSAAPAALRPSFAGGLIRRLPPEAAAATLAWLAGQTHWDRSILLPLEVHGAVTEAIDVGHAGPLRDLLNQSLALAPDASTAVLDVLEAEAKDRPGARAVLAEHLAVTLGTGTADLRGAIEVHRWATGLGQSEQIEAWLDPFWRRQFADALNLDHWRAFFRHLPPELARPLTPVVLQVAVGSRAVDEAVRWGIEELVLPLDEADRPHHPAWPGAYLDRLPSGLDLLKRLVKKPYTRLGVRRWLDQARQRGELTEAQAARFDDCQRYERVLRSGDARALFELKLPDVPAEERGTLLGQILRHLGDGSDEALNLSLDTCRAAWPAGFAPGAAGLGRLAESLAEPLLTERGYPELWLDRLQRVLDRLGLAASSAHGFEPDGLASLVVAVTTRHSGETFDPWRLRMSLLRHDLAWKALAADIGRDIDDIAPEDSPKVLDDWDQALAKGPDTRRFYELWFNVCSRLQLVHLIVSRAADIKSFTIGWWAAERSPGARNDVRERLVREAPMVPLRQGSLTSVRHWLRRPASRLARSSQEDFVPIEGESATEGTYEWLISDEGRLRWAFLEELTLFAMAGTMDARLERLKSWLKLLPLQRLPVSDRYELLASLIRTLEDDDPVLIACLAKWLFRGSASDVEQVKCWDQKLEAVDPVPHELVLLRVALVRRLCDELKTLRREEQERARKTGATGSP